MKKVKFFGLLVVVAVAATAAFATSAFAAKAELKFLGTESVPVKLEGKTTTAGIFLESALGTKITATELKFAATIEKLGPPAEGKISAEFTGAEFSSKACETEGLGKAGVIQVSGTGVLGFDNLTALAAAVKLTINEVKIKCGTTGLTVKGELVTLIKPINSDTTAFTANTKCLTTKKGSQEDQTFWLDSTEAAKEKIHLTANLGLGNEEACQNVPGELSLTANKMFEIKA